MKQTSTAINRGTKSTPRRLLFIRVFSGVLFSRLSNSVKLGLAVMAVLFAIITPVLYTRIDQPVATAAPNNTVNFQARLLTNTGALVPDGNYHVEFKIYSQASGGTLHWTETRTTGNLVAVKNGYISVALGSVNALSNASPAIDWGDDNYLSMNIGGSGGAASWNGEMSPRMLITSVPYALRSAEATTLKAFNGANSTTLSATAPTANRSILLPDADGTVCLQSSASCGFLSGTTGIQLQGSTPGTAQTGNFNITGTGIVGVLQASTSVQTSLLDTASAGALSIGTTNATQINLNQNTIVAAGKNLSLAAGAGNVDFSASTGTFASGTGTVTLNGNTTVSAAKTLTVTSGLTSLTSNATTGDALNVSNSTSTGNIAVFSDNVTPVFTIGDSGTILFKGIGNSANAFRVQRTGGDPIFSIDTSLNRIKVGNDSAGSGADSTLFVLDSATTTNQPTGVNGGSFYDTTLNKFRCYENGAYKDCDTGVTSVGAVSGTSTANGASITGTTLNLAVADGTNAGLLSTVAQTIAGAKTFTGVNTFSSAGTALQVTNNATIGGTLGVTGLTTATGGLSTGASSLLTVGGATLNNTLAIANLDYSGSGNTGSIGTAGATVDIYTSFTINQTTAGQTLTIPAPTTTTTGRLIYITNIGSAGYTIGGSVASTGTTMAFVWNNTTSAWTLVSSGTSGNYIQNGTAIQTANFNVQSNAIGSVTATIQGANSQTANIIEVKAAGVGTPLFSVGANGATQFQNSTDSTTGFAVRKATGVLLLNVDSTNNEVEIGSWNGGVGPIAGKLVVANAGNGNTITLQSVASPTASRVINLPDEAGTICIQNSTNCGFTTGSGAAVLLAPASVQVDASTNNSIFINKTGASGNILQLQKSGVDALTLSNGGILSVRPTSNTVSAINVVNVAGATTFEVKSNNGTDNLFMGTGAPTAVVTGTTNLGIGANVLASLSGGSENVGIGSGVLQGATSGAGNTAIGIGAAAQQNGSNNVAIGKYALAGVAPAVGNTGSSNVAIGFNALNDISTGSFNVGIGANAFANTTTVDSNTGVGVNAGLNNLTGAGNVALGRDALYRNETGSNNVALGNNAGGYSAIAYSFSNNVLVGTETGNALQTNANNNILIGYRAGNAITTGTTNIMLGYDIDAQSATTNNQLSIGNLIFGQGGFGTGTTVGTGTIGIGTATTLTAKLSVDNGAAAIPIFVARDNNTDVFTIADGGNITATGTLSVNNTATVRGLTTNTATATDDQITLSVTAGGAARFTGTITNGVNDLTANRTYTLPDASGTIQLAPASGSYLLQVPSSSAVNTVTPTAAGVSGLTVNGTSNVTTAGTALVVTQANAATAVDGANINLTNTANTLTNGLLINRNGAGGTTTNLLNLTNTAGTATNALTFTGTFTNLINSTNFSVTNAGAVTAVGVNSGTGLLQGTGGLTVTGATSINASGATATNIGTGTNTGLVTIGNNTNAANTVTIAAGATNGINLNAPKIESNAATLGLFTTPTTVNAFTAATTIAQGASGGTTTFGNGGAYTLRSTTGQLTLQSGSGTLSFGSTTALTATGALGITSGGANALTLDAGGAASLSVGLTSANAVSISRTGITTTVNGNLTVAETVNLNGNTTLGNAITDRLTVTSQILGASPLVFQGATDNGFTTTFTITDPTANNVITFPNASGTVQLTPGSGSYLLQVPATSADNTVTPTANGVVGLTVNGTSGTAATALNVVQGGNASALVVNATSTGTVLQLQKSGTDLLNLSNTGALLVQNSADSTSALQIKTSTGGTNVVGLNYDTTNQQLSVRNKTDAATLGADIASVASGTGTNWTGTNPYTHTAGSAVALTFSLPAITASTTYEITYTTAGTTIGERFTPTIGGVAGSAIYGDVTAETQVITTTGTGSLLFTPTASATGTLTLVSLKIITNNTSAFAVNDSTGTNRLELRATSNNMALGSQSLQSNVSGTYNTAIGLRSLRSNTTGIQNTGIGWGTLMANTSGNDNTAIGFQSLSKNTTGTRNTATGFNSLTGNTTGAYNTAYGYGSLEDNTTGTDNTAYGASSLLNNTSGIRNTATGYNTLQLNTSGSNNIAIGWSTGNNITTGSTNILLGYDIDAQSATGSSQLSIGNLIFGQGGFGTGTSAGAGIIGIGTATTLTAKLTVDNRAAAIPIFVARDNNVDVLTIADGGDITATGTLSVNNTATVRGLTTNTATATDDQITLSVTAGGAARFTGTITNGVNDLTANRTYTLPDASGTFLLAPAGSGNALIQVPTSDTAGVAGANVISPTANSIVSLRVNGTTGTTTNALQVNTPVTADTTATVLVTANTTGSKGLVIQTLNGATQNAFQVQNYLGTVQAGISASGRGFFGSNGGPTDTMMYINTGATTNRGIVIKPQPAQTANLIDFQDSGGTLINASFGPNGNQLTLGRIAASGTVVPGLLTVSDGTTSNFGSTLQSATLTANRTITMPNEDGTICLQNSVNCGFATTSGVVLLAPAAVQTDASTNNSIFINKTGASGNILQLQRGGVDALTLSNGGILSVRPTSNTVGAISVVNVAGTTTFEVKSNNGTSNLLIGSGTQTAAITGARNLGLGSNVLANLTSGDDNTAIGYNALYSNQNGTGNLALGAYALDSNTSGTNNVGLGFNALSANVAGQENVAVGDNALLSASGASYNTAIGRGSSYNTTGGSNTAVGFGSLYRNTAGTNNVALGYAAGGWSSGGPTYSISNNTLLGYETGNLLETGGNNNILIGYRSGNAITSGANNIMLGYDIDAQSASASNQLSIGNLIFGQGGFGTGTTVGAGTIGIGTATTLTAKLTVDNGAAAIPIFVARDNNTDVLTIADNGSALFKNSANSATAFQVQASASATPVLNVDTTNRRVGINTAAPNAALNVNDGGLTFTGTTPFSTVLSLSGNTVQATSNTSQYAIQNQANFDLSLVSGATLANIYGMINIPNISVAGGKTVTNATGEYIRVDNTGSATISNIFGLKVANGGATSTDKYGIYVDNVTGGSSLNYPLYLKSSAAGELFSVNNTGQALLKNSANSTTAFQIQNAGGTPLLTVDSTNSALTVDSNVTLSSGRSLTVTGGNTASRPASPVEGMLYFDSDTKQLLVYANGRWQSNRSTATVIVSDASTTIDYNRADFVVPAASTTAETTINSAIATLGAGGGAVVLLDGTYTVDGSIVLPSNVTLVGQGASTVIKVKNAHNIALDVITNSDTTNGNDSIKITNLKLDGNKANNTAGTQRGIVLTAGNAGTKLAHVIDSVWASNFRNDGVYLNASPKGTQVKGSNFTYNTGYGVYVDATQQSLITNNNINNNGVTDTSGGGLRLSGTSDDSVVSGNSIVSNLHYGIFAQNARRSQFLGNIISTNQNTQFYLETQEAVVTGNSIKSLFVGGSTTRYGLWVTAGATNNISNNSIFGDSGSALRIENSLYNVVSNNAMGCGGSATNYCIALVGADDALLSGNNMYSVSGTARAAVNIDATTDRAIVTNNTWSGVGIANPAITDNSVTTLYNQKNDAGDYRIQAASGRGVILTNPANSATAFSVQDSGSASLFTVNTLARTGGVAGNTIKVGNSTGTDTATTILQVDSATADPTTNLASLNGGLYYNSTTNKLSVVENSLVQQVCTTGAVCTGYAPSATNGYVQLAPAAAQTDATNNNSIFIDKTSGTGNILQLQKSGVDNVLVTNSGKLVVTDGSSAPAGWGFEIVGKSFGMSGTTSSNTPFLFGQTVQSSSTAQYSMQLQNSFQLDHVSLPAAVSNMRGLLVAPSITNATGKTISSATGTEVRNFKNDNANPATITNRIALRVTEAANTGTISNNYGIWVDDLSGTAGTTNDYPLYLKSSASGEIFSVNGTGQALFKNSVNSATALQVQSSASATSVLNVDTTNNRVGINTNAPTATLQVASGNVRIDGSLVAASTPKFFLGGTVQDSNTSFNYGFQNSIFFNFANDVTNVYGLNNIANLQTAAGAVDVTTATGTLSRVDVTTAYGGTLNEGNSFLADQPNFGNGTVSRFPNYNNFKAIMPDATVGGQTGNSSNTTGTINNNGIILQGGSAAAGAGGTLANNNVNIVLASGSSAGTTNRGIYITGNGGGASTNYAIFSSSTATSYLQGALALGGASAFTPTGDVTFGAGADRVIDVRTQTTAATAGNNLTVRAATGNTTGSGGTLTLQGGTGGATGAGGAIAINGGNAGGGTNNGGSITVSGGTGAGTGVKGVVNLSTTAFSASGTVSFGASNTLNTLLAGAVNNYSTVPVNATAPGTVLTVDLPAITTVGRVLYITAVSGSNDFGLLLSGTSVNISMKANSTATLIYNGTGWTAAGASSSTTLQAAYDNTLTSAGGAELVLAAAGGAADGLTVRNNGTTPIVGGLLEVQTSIGSNLFSVNNNATEYATNGGAESSTFTGWAASTGGTVTKYVTPGVNIATGQASVSVVTGALNHGAKDTLNTTLTPNLQYSVSFAAKAATANFSTLDVYFSRDGTTTAMTTCKTGATVTTSVYTRVSCTFTAPATGITAANGIIIRQSDATGRTFYLDNLSVNVNASSNFAVDGSVDDAGNFATYWTAAPGGGTVTRDTTNPYDTSASAKVVTTATAGHGIRNNMAINPSINTQYLVSFYAQSSNTFNDILVRYSRDGGTNFVSCADYNTQSVGVTPAWTKITCLFTTDGTAPSNADLVITQTAGTARSIWIDALTVTLNTNNASNVQIGGANEGGPATLFTLDRASSAPIAANNDAYLGSMYYDTSSGRIQCYEADGWGACGAAPDNIVNLNPEYAGAVLNGTGVGTMTTDFCSNDAQLSVNSGLCSAGQAKNFYKWTSPQATQQTYSIYVTYQLPATFKGFSDDNTVQLTGLVDNTSNASVTYEMFKSDGGDVTTCGTETNVITGGGGAANTWYSYGINGNESTGCSFTTSSAGNFVIFKINMKANSGANAYVSTLSFTTTGR